MNRLYWKSISQILMQGITESFGGLGLSISPTVGGFLFSVRIKLLEKKKKLQKGLHPFTSLNNSFLDLEQSL